MKGEVPDGEHRRRARHGEGRARRATTCTILALGADGAASRSRRPSSSRPSDGISRDGRSTCARWCRSTRETILEPVGKTGPALHGRGEPAPVRLGSRDRLDRRRGSASATSTGPIVRITTPHVPLPSADLLEDNAIPSVDRIVETDSQERGLMDVVMPQLGETVRKAPSPPGARRPASGSRRTSRSSR